MSHSIICNSPEEIGSSFHYFLDQLQSPEPCCLTLEDCLHHDNEDFEFRKRYCSESAITDEPKRWANILFEPEDVIEFRLRPPREISEQLLPRQFLQAATTRHHGIYPWAFLNDLNTIVNKLVKLNGGCSTSWGLPDITTGDWTDIDSKDGIPLNVYAGVNPRMVTGCSRNEDVLLARNLFVDLDKTTLEQAMEKLKGTKFPIPTMIVVSGHGVHFYWRLKSPITDLAIWTSAQKRLIKAFNSDQAIHDPSRVMRVPGFENVNGEPTKCFIHEADSTRRYVLDDLLTLLPSIERLTTKPAISNQAISVKRQPSIDHLTLHGESKGNLLRAEAYADKFQPVEENRNTTAFQRTCSLVEKFDLVEDEVLPLIEKANDKANDPLDEGELDEVVQKAVRHVHRKGKPRGTALNETERTEKYCEQTKNLIALDAWRDELQKCRLESLGKYGTIFFDGSTTGAGKSTADLAAIKKANKSAIFLPTHDACEEEAVKLIKLGLSAAAHPPMNNETCQKYGSKENPGPAQLAQKAGLNVGQCICTTCPFFNQCEYQKRRELARKSDHTICTHTRASLSDFESANDKQIIFIHEDVTSLFRPMVKVFHHAAKQDTPQVRHLLDIVHIAQAAQRIAVTWSNEPALAFAQNLETTTNDLISELNSSDLVKALEDAAQTGKNFTNLQTVKEISVKQKIERHQNLDHFLQRAMDQAGIRANGNALKLAVAFSLGELDQLCVVVDDIKTTGGKPVFTKALVGVWRVMPPDHCVVWIENASTTAKAVEDITGRKVIDKTPNGRLEHKLPPLQLPDAEITQQSGGNRVRSVVRGLLAKYPDAKKIGIISHKCHQAEIDLLAPTWTNRISRKEYFRSGKDRASNSWLDCDLILIVGTPRVPKHAVRDLLIQTGKVNAASRIAKFGDVSWEGKNQNGDLVIIDGLGYDDPDWADAYSQLVKETLLQAIGRGRSVTETSVQVLVASNESLGLTLADYPLRLVNDSEDETLQLTVSATARNAKYNTLAIGAVNFIVTDTVAKLSKYKLRAVRSHLLSLSLSGLLMKQGARGGWRLAEWLLNSLVSKSSV